MTIRPTRLATQLGIAFGSLVLIQGGALAQSLERVEITGSSIKRIAAEGALPVITLNKKDIEQSGATSVRDLVQALPSMQGFTTASDSVNGGGGGTTTASLRNLGSIYTLVLLNGRRVAPFNTGSTVNLEQLPLAMIDRVEILADGASTLYGADAIAGVVNFITKKNSTEGGIDISVSKPQKKGGDETQLSISKGFGNLETDGFNVMAGLSIEKQKKILASDREFSKTGRIPFESGGRSLYMYQTSVNSNPPNVFLFDANEDLLAGYNPIKILNGNCGTDPATFAFGDFCRFDFGATVEAQPESERENLFLSGRFKLGSNFTAFGEALVSNSSMSAHYAAPAQPLSMVKGDVLYNRYITPSIAALGIADADVAFIDYNMRLSDAGLRGDNYKTKANHFVLGVEGSAFGFDGSVSYTMSSNKQDDVLDGGFASRIAFDQLVANGAFDPFAQGTDASKAALAPALLTGLLASETKSSLDTLSFRGSGPAFDLAGNSTFLGFGADFSKQTYSNIPAPIFQGPNVLQPSYADFPLGSGNGQLPFDTTRKSRGIYAELLLPFSKTLEVTTALRNDSYDAAKNSFNFDAAGALNAPATQGNSASKTTYKLGLRFQPTQELLIRGSYGTGFRVPTLNDITAPLADFGVIGTARACPVTAPDPLAAGCRPVPTQWRKMKGGNALAGEDGLKPENSEQWTLGFRLEPSKSLSLGAEFWSVKVKDVITPVPEDTAFDNFETYRALFSVTTDPASTTGRQIFTFNEVPVNGAVAASKGVDLDVTARTATPIGRLTSSAQVTYLFSSYFDYGFGGGKESSIGKLGSDDQVAFRTLLRLQATLDSGDFSNTLTMYWKPGYTDQTYVATDGIIYNRNPDGSRGAATSISDWEVPAYYTFDWQGKWTVTKAFSITAGIKNLLDKKPPLSIKTVGGNMVGVDPRYADIKGRTFGLAASYKF